MSRAASATHHHQLTTDDDDDELMISDSGPMPRRFAAQNRGASGASTSSRQSSHPPLSPPVLGSSAQRATAATVTSSSSSVASGNRSGSGDASEGASSIGGVSLGRAMSVSSVSSINSTSSLEAVPFREAPLGNVRLGFGGAAFRSAARNGRTHPYGALAMPMCQDQPLPAQQQPLGDVPAPNGQSIEDGAGDHSSAIPAAATRTSTDSAALSSSASALDRHKGVPKPLSDTWMYRVGPGMRTNRSRGPTPVAAEAAEVPTEDSAVPSSPAKRSRDVLRQKFVKGAGRLGIKTNIVTGLGPQPSDQYAAHNPADSSEDEANLLTATRTPLPRSSSYFTSAPHSAGSAATTPLHPSLTPVPADFRTSSVTKAPLFVPKYAEDLLPTGLTPQPYPSSSSASPSYDARLSITPEPGQATSPTPFSYPVGSFSILSDRSPYLTADSAGNDHVRRRSSATSKPPLLRAESSNDAFDRTASPGLMVNDPGAADAPAAEPTLFTLATPVLSAQPPSQADPAVTPLSNAQLSPHPTPAEVVRMEAQAGIASLPDSPSEPSPIPISYSPVVGDEGPLHRRHRDSSHSRVRRPSSGTGSEASVSIGPANAGSSRRPDSTQRQRPWSNTKRPAFLRARTSENSISGGRRSQSLDRRTSSPGPQSPIDGPSLGPSISDRPGSHSKNSSNSTVPGNELCAQAPPHVSVIPEDEDGTNHAVDAERSAVLRGDSPSLASSRPSSSIDVDQPVAMSPSSAATLPLMVRPIPTRRSASPASQLARSPETIRVGPARITDSIYGRSPASISNLRSARLPSSPASVAPDRPTTPSSRTSTARCPNDFHFGETLGEGSYSTVLEAWDLLSGPSPKEPGAVDPNATSAAAAMVGADTSRKRRRKIDLTGRKAYAIKVLDKVHILKQGKQKYVAIEKEALSRMIRHPGVVTLFWTFQDRDSLYFVLELASNGELLNFIRKHGSFDVASARFYAAELADTIDAMHRAGVVHRDVKPENVLLNARHHVKVTDFGSAKIVHPPGEADAEHAPPAAQPGSPETAPMSQRSRAASFVGTAEYVPPELLVEKAQPAGKPADWWAFGCVLFQMLAGRPPFKGVNEYQTLQKVKNREFAFPVGFPEDAQDLIDRVLTLDPSQRPSASEIKAHRFFSTIDFHRLWDADAPEIETGLVQPLPVPQSRDFGDASDFSFDEGFGTSDESQAYNGDTQSIDYQGGGGPDESSLSLDAVSSGQPNDADDSDLSDASSNVRRLPRRQSGLQRLAEGIQSRFLANSTSSAPTESGGAAPRRKFSTMSIDAANQAGGHLASENGNQATGHPLARGTRHSARSAHLLYNDVGSSPSSNVRNQQQTLTPENGGGSPASTPSQVPASPSGLQQSWAALLLPKEVMLYSLPVVQKKTGTGKMFTKRRQLVLTDFPRLLCVKDTAAALKVKSEVILAIQPKLGGIDATSGRDSSSSAVGAQSMLPTPKAGDFERISGRHASVHSDVEASDEDITAANVRSSQLAIPNLLTGIEYKGGKAFTIRTANGRSFLYETLSGDASALVRRIQEARRSAA